MPKLRVGMIVDEGSQPYLVQDMIERSQVAKHYDLSCLIVQSKPHFKRSFLSYLLHFLRQKGMGAVFNRVVFKLLTLIEKSVIARRAKYQSYFSRRSLSLISTPKLHVVPLVSNSGLVWRYTNDDLVRIRNETLDVLVHSGSGILRGDILHHCQYGVISFHHADHEVNRGGPPGFWEVYERSPSTGFMIQQLCNELDGGEVYVRGSIMTSSMFLLNQVRIYSKANVFMHHFLEDLGANKRLPVAHQKWPYAHCLYTIPSVFNQYLYLQKTLCHLIGKLLAKFFSKSLPWGVAYQFVSDWQSAVMWRSTIINNPPGRFLADPFVFTKRGKTVCFVEDYNYTSAKGSISAFQLEQNGYRNLGVVLREPFHLSFPFLFEVDDVLYMCPESSEANEIRLYKCVGFPCQWVLHKVLMRDVSAADSQIVQFGGRWWMFTNVDSAGIDDHCSELHLFYADQFDSESWQPHSLNPVIFDSQRARNGGMLFDGGGIYRVFQVQGFDCYGASMGIAAIKTLTTQAYEEEVVSSIKPRFFSGIKGTHTYSFDQGVVVFDFVKRDWANR